MSKKNNKEFIELLINDIEDNNQRDFVKAFNDFLERMPDFHASGKVKGQGKTKKGQETTNWFQPSYVLGGIYGFANSELKQALTISDIHWKLDESSKILNLIFKNTNNFYTCRTFIFGDDQVNNPLGNYPGKTFRIKPKQNGGGFEIVLEKARDTVELFSNTVLKDLAFNTIDIALETPLELLIHQLSLDDLETVKQYSQNFLSEMDLLYQDLLSHIPARSIEAMQHGFFYGLLTFAFKNRFAIDAYVERIAGKGYADLIFIVREDNPTQAILILIEFKSGKVTILDGLKQLENLGYLEHMLSIRTFSKKFVAYSVNLESNTELKKFQLYVKNDFPQAKNVIESLIVTVVNDSGNELLQEPQVLNILKYAYFSYYANHDATHFNRLLLGHLLSLDNKKLDHDKKIFLFDNISDSRRGTFAIVVDQSIEGSQLKNRVILNIIDTNIRSSAEKVIPFSSIDSNNIEKIVKINVKINSQEKNHKAFFQTVSIGPGISTEQKYVGKFVSLENMDVKKFISFNLNDSNEVIFDVETFIEQVAEKTFYIRDFLKKEQRQQYNEKDFHAFLQGALAGLPAEIEINGKKILLNRNRTEFTEILGLLTNTVPINISINPDNCFIEICQQVNSLINQVRENINYTFNPENLLENFNFMFIYKNAEANSVVDAFYGKGEKTQFDLALICIKKLDSVSFILEYNSDLFHKNSIRNFAEVFKNLLLQISKNQLKSINQYKINSKSREKLIINQFCHGSKFSHAYKNAFEIFEKVAVRNPKLIALQFYEIAFTYEEVLTKCNLIANQLYPKHKIVGIFLNRSIDVVMAILAVLRAGAAYVPLDPNYPQQQLKYMYDQSGMDCILTNTSTLASSNTDFLAKRTKIINMDHIKICKNLPILPQACLNNLAYIIYTSGSTGKPKGVMVTHGNLVNTILACNKYLNIPKNSRFSQFFSINFDASILDIFLCFHYESTLYIIDEMTRKQPDSLILFFKKNKINIANLTPAILSLFAKTLLPNLHTLILGGDVPEQSAINYWLQNRNLYNAYGPTETTIVATIHRYKNHDNIENIGKPLPNFSCYILNENLQLLPTGVIGELYISGKSLARGYVGRDDLTEERFISIPHIDSKTKLYKTGDRVYWNNAGDIIFMGRNDSQVKFRGYRIELGNIESCLSQLNYINQSVVILIEQNGVRYLIAYYTLKDKVKTNFDIKKDLRKLLPEYMIPTQYMCLDYFPITANGKIDKRNLPQLSIQSDIKKISPRTTLEKDIATTWANVLGIPNESIGINDSFYDLGGQSLSLAKMISELSAKHAIQVDYASFMSNPTIEFIIEQLSTNIDIIGIERKDIKQAIEDIQVSFPKNKFLKAANFQTPKHILLTGATGFVGTYLLQELLHSTEATIHCLIRDPSKINNTSPRVISYISDLTKPYLGLKKDEYESLSGSIDAIYHCAAYVNHILGYTVLRSANVLATKTLIDLVTRGKPKAFHYISTISCATIEDERGQILEAWPSRTPTSLTGGYALSKWAAECLVKKAKEANYHCSIYRLGNVTGDSATGYSRIEDNHVYLFLKGCLQMGYAPEMNDFVEMTPVDILSKAIFSLSTNPKSKGEVFQLNNPSLISWDNLFRSFAPVANNIKLIPFSKWQKEHLSNIDESNALYPLKALYMGKFENKLKKYDTKKTQNLLKRLGIEYPKDYTQLLKLYTTFSNKIKFF